MSVRRTAVTRAVPEPRTSQGRLRHLRESGQQGERRLVGPMEVLEHEHRRSRQCDAEQLGHRDVQAIATERRRESGDLGRFRDGGAEGDRDEREPWPDGRDQAVDPLGQALAGRIRIGVGGDPGEFPEAVTQPAVRASLRRPG